jgi:malonate transporter
MPSAVAAILPVVLLTALGWIAGRRQWIRASAVKDLSNLVFLILTPALLFRTMSRLEAGHIPLTPALTYFGASIALFFAVLLVRGWTRESSVQGLAAIFGNTFMIGVPVVGLAYGEAGLAQLLPLISLHALVLLTLGTLALELAPQQRPRDAHPVRAALQAMRSALLHPAPLPVLAGLAWAQTGWGLHEAIDTGLRLLGQALGPIALLLVGVSLSHARVASQWRGSLVLALLKTVAHPLSVLGMGLLLGLGGVPLAVVIVTACLPIGANVYIFSQRYGVAGEQVTAAMALSTLTALMSLTVVLAGLAGR